MVTTVPTLQPPPGDPSTLRAAAQRLGQTAGATAETEKRLSTADAEVGRVWESGAQRMFSVLAGGWGQIATGAASIMSRYAEELARYATVLEASQLEVRRAQQRLDTLAASTPPGTGLDQAAVLAIVAQARQASQQATVAARELTSVASNLIGPVNATDGPWSSRDTQSSLVSRSHLASAGLTPTAAARRFDAQASHLKQQLTGVLNGIVGLAGNPSAAGASPTTMTIGPTSLTNATPAGPSFITLGGTPPRDPNSLITVRVGLPDPSTNPALALAQAADNTAKRSALQIWERAFPGVPPPDTNAGGILRQILERGGADLHPSIVQAVSIVHSGIAYGNRVLSLPPGYTLTRRYI